MKLKSSLVGLVLLLSFGLTTKVVWAAEGAFVTQTAARLTTIQEKADARVTKAATAQANELTRIQEKAASMIDQRITSLNKLLSRLSEDSKLSTEDKTTMSNDIQTTITNLQTLKAKIQADTDTTTARTDAKTIVTSYHIYAIYEPKLRLLIAVNNLMTIAANIQTLSTSVQNFLNDEKAKGVDITTAQAALTDITTKQLADINTKLAADKAALTNLSVSSTDGTAKTTFTQVKQDIVTVKQDLANIRQDFAKIRTSLIAAVKSTALSGTPTAHLSCIPRPKCLDASPKCAIAEPTNGWCPAASAATPTVGAPTATPTP